MTEVNRFNAWAAILAFSSVVLGAVVQDPVINFERDMNDKYVISCFSIAIVLSALTLSGYLFTEKLVGGIFEASMGTIIFALMCAAIALVMNPKNELAIEVAGLSHIIRNTNLYFFTWAAFISSAYVLASILQQYRLVDVQAVKLSLVRWYLFLLASVVVLGTGSKVKELTCDDQFSESDLCQTTKYAISLGVVSAGLAFVLIIWTHMAKLNLIAEAIVSVIVTVLYCVGAAYITEVGGPGSNIGNLYFATWFGFSLAVLLTFSCFKEMIAPEPVAEESQHPEVNKTKPQQGEGEVQGQDTEAQRGGEEQLEDIDVEGRDED